METFYGVIVVFFLILLIMVAITRWIFRINVIIDRLDRVIAALGAYKRPGKD